MRAVLNQLNTLAGVVGTMVFDPEGQVLAHAFPAVFDAQDLASAAEMVANGETGLETITGRINSLDLRFGESRLVVRPLAGARLLLLCTAQANLQFLNISVGMALPKLEKMVANRPPAAVKPGPAPAAAPPPKAEEAKVGDLSAFEKAFMKMDGWLRKQSGE